MTSASMSERLRTLEFRKRFLEGGPYYTSYPALGFWQQEFVADTYSMALRDFFEKEGNDAPLALYIHIPFCAKLCWYCVCNITITNNSDTIQLFLDHMLQEIEMFQTFFDRNSISPNIREIHLGGGTPSHLSNRQFAQLVAKLGNLVKVDDLDEFAMEIDPRTTTQENLHFFSDQGITRISFGVQDFDPNVQEAINRVQPWELVDELLSPDVRKGFSGVNFDLLYGLPLQTRETFSNTVQIVQKLSPERVTLLKYAHLPEVRKHMKLIKESDLPVEEELPSMFVDAVESFCENNYEWIGIDNFAKKDDVLAVAARNKTLGRDFNGWNAGRAMHLIGIGPTSTAAFGNYYCQNVYGTSDYYKAIRQRKFPSFRGYTLTKDDVIRREVIFRILCHQVVDFSDISARFHCDYREYFADELHVLREGFDDDVLHLSGDTLNITRFGRFYIRSICKTFDKFVKGSAYRISGP